MSSRDFSQLDLFAPVPLAPAAGDEGGRASPPVGPQAGLAGQPSSAPTSAPASASDAAIAPGLTRHPRGSHRIQLGGQWLTYELKRARRRSIGMQVSDQGLSVSAPKWVSIPDIEQALQTKGDWIVRKLADQQRRLQRLEASRIEWRDGASIPFMGQPALLKLLPSGQGVHLKEQADGPPILEVGMALNAQPDQIRDRVQGWLQWQAKAHFQVRCQHYAQQLGVKFTALKLSSAQTRWGSATADGVIRLNWRLVHFSPSVIDYVVAHELAHLREMNHSPRFWDVVRSVMPDYEQVKGQLRHELVAPLDD